MPSYRWWRRFAPPCRDGLAAGHPCCYARQSVNELATAPHAAGPRHEQQPRRALPDAPRSAPSGADDCLDSKTTAPLACTLPGPGPRAGHRPAGARSSQTHPRTRCKPRCRTASSKTPVARCYFAILASRLRKWQRLHSGPSPSTAVGWLPVGHRQIDACVEPRSNALQVKPPPRGADLTQATKRGASWRPPGCLLRKVCPRIPAFYQSQVPAEWAGRISASGPCSTFGFAALGITDAAVHRATAVCNCGRRRPASA